MILDRLPTVEELSAIFWYDAIGGKLIRRVDGGRWGREKEGAVVGSLSGNGYLMVIAYGQRLLCHRVAFSIAHGEWPKGQIDHIDGDKLNNKLSNLRDVSPAGNSQNQRRARGNTASGLLGVCRQRKRWKAEIKVDGEKRFLGSFDTPEEAHAAYIKAKRELHPCCTI